MLRACARQVKGPPVLLDTNVVSFIQSGSGLGKRYESLIEGWDRHIALVTLGEMLHGAYWRGWGPSRTMEQWAFIGTLEIIIPTPAMASLAASFVSERRACGRPLEWNDAWIAATAVTCQCPLVTHDGDFTGLEGLYVISDHRAFRTGPACTIYGTRQTRWLESAA